MSRLNLFNDLHIFIRNGIVPTRIQLVILQKPESNEYFFKLIYDNKEYYVDMLGLKTICLYGFLKTLPPKEYAYMTAWILGGERIK